MPQSECRSRRALLWAVGLAAGITIPALLTACQDPAGPPPTLASGRVSFDFSGAINGSFTADGRCYWSDGYPTADSACALALDLGDTLRIRAVRDPRTISWIHVNVQFPEDGVCAVPGDCRIAFDRISVGGKVQRSYQAADAAVSITSQTADRVQGTFSGLAQEVDGEPADTVRITDGAFDVPVER